MKYLAKKYLRVMFLVLSTFSLVPGADALDQIRGRLLYETHCGECHSESVHGRRVRMAKDYEDVRQWVKRWNIQLGAYWQSEEIEDVTAYLNTVYYQYPPTGIRF